MNPNPIFIPSIENLELVNQVVNMISVCEKNPSLLLFKVGDQTKYIDCGFRMNEYDIRKGVLGIGDDDVLIKITEGDELEITRFVLNVVNDKAAYVNNADYAAVFFNTLADILPEEEMKQLHFREMDLLTLSMILAGKPTQPVISGKNAGLGIIKADMSYRKTDEITKVYNTLYIPNSWTMRQATVVVAYRLDEETES